MALSCRFGTDEHISAAVVKAVRKRGLDVRRAHEASLLGARDEVHLARALDEARVFITKDADCLRLHGSGVPHAGIVFAQGNAAPGSIVRAVARVHAILSSEEKTGRVEFVRA